MSNITFGAPWITKAKGLKERVGSQSRLQRMELETVSRHNEFNDLSGGEGSLPVAFAPILFDPRQFNRPITRSPAEASVFLERAPIDWIFTGSRGHTNSLRVRAFLYGATWQNCQLPDAAYALKITPRTLNRRLKEEGTSFQDIKDALRRDIAIRALKQGTDSIEQIAFDTGFSAPSNFHRAFHKWTSRTPGSYRL